MGKKETQNSKTLNAPFYEQLTVQLNNPPANFKSIICITASKIESILIEGVYQSWNKMITRLVQLLDNWWSTEVDF